MAMRFALLATFMSALFFFPCTAASSPQAVTDQEAVVLKLYRDYSWEAVINQRSWKGLFDQPSEILNQYFDDKLTSLIVKEAACSRQHGLCKLDFSPIWCSQDPGATDLEAHLTSNPNVVSVSFRYPSNNELAVLSFVLSKTSKGWRISDIKGPNWSLLALLSEPSEIK